MSGVTLYWHPGIIVGEGRSTHLRPMEKRLLVTLARSRPGDCRCNRLIQVLWTDPDAEPADARNNLDVHINRLKRKIGPFGLRIVTHWGMEREVLGTLHVDWRRSASVRWADMTALPCRAYELAA